MKCVIFELNLENHTSQFSNQKSKFNFQARQLQGLPGIMAWPHPSISSFSRPGFTFRNPVSTSPPAWKADAT